MKATSSIASLLLFCTVLPLPAQQGEGFQRQPGERRELIIRLLPGPGQSRLPPQARVSILDGSGQIVSKRSISANVREAFSVVQGDYQVLVEAAGYWPVRRRVSRSDFVGSRLYVEVRMKVRPDAAPPPGQDQTVHIGELTLPPQARKQLLKAQEASDAGDYATAVNYVKKAIKICPKCYQAHNNLAVLFLRQRKVEEAEEALSEALRLRPGDEMIRKNLAIVRQYLAQRDGN